MARKAHEDDVGDAVDQAKFADGVQQEHIDRALRPLVEAALRDFQAKVHRDLPPTTFWGYGGMSPGPRAA